MAAVMSLPPWLFDELADNSDDTGDLVLRARAWDELLVGAEEGPRGVEYTRLAGTDKPVTVKLTFGEAVFLRRLDDLAREGRKPA
jgi:hypothetical protein